MNTTNTQDPIKLALEKIAKAHAVVSALCDGTQKWTMSVPARVDSDPDLVISAALRHAEAALQSTAPQPQGDVVVTWDHDRTRILAVTRQNDDHQIVEVIAEAPATQASEPSAEVRIPRCFITDVGFRWDGDAQHHVPKLVVEFEPVPVGATGDAKGWKDRDALADLLAHPAAPPWAVEPLTRAEIREAASAADEGQEDMELSIAFANRVVKAFCNKNGIQPPKD